MARIPRSVGIVLKGWRSEFSLTVWNRFFAILMAAILTRGTRTILRVHTLADQLAPGHVSSLHRVFSHLRWSIVALAKALAVTVVETPAPESVSSNSNSGCDRLV